jgi:NAD(P)-dependent dehydrogenase (short-subunit alcohol dehydrogenase family)
MVRTYAAENNSTTVRANCFSPGPTRTKMRAQAMPGEDPETLPTAEDVASQIITLCLPSFTDNGAVYRRTPEGLVKVSP